MVVEEVAETLLKRREELALMLEKNNIELEKQHQIYGAINEIDLFLQTMNYYHKNYKEEDIGKIKLVKPVEADEDFLSKIFGGIKKNK